MKENLLHYIWKYKKYPVAGIRTTKGHPISVQSSGTHNHLSGPDFFNAKLSIDEQMWAGNVEIHIKSSDWYAHNHETDSNYDSVILHVVWEDNVAVFRADGSEIPTLELHNYISTELLSNYQKLFQQKPNTFINCGKDITEISSFNFDNWKERLYFERLEHKSEVVLKLLEASKNDWEKVLFILLLKSFGSTINGELFLEVAKYLDFSIIRKLQNKPMELEALLFGLSGLLETEHTDLYYLQLRKNYDYLAHKYQLDKEVMLTPQFFKLRPPNFPTIRLSQIAQLYAKSHSLFFNAMQNENTDLYGLFSVHTSEYWENHFTFGKVSKISVKKTSKKFIDLLVINTILPLKFCYLKRQGKFVNDTFTKPIDMIPAEKNSIIQQYQELGVNVDTAKDSQALLELYTNYCTKNKCLQCAVGSELLTLKT
ncbi:DUF2851 family protein [Maribacter antarcticus]|uniref:DUF2851 family protein n=1 Tax=Maribacter antarcticus TaxID=505250 RepID=UPI00047EC889|nr:DUF2851 family protein [Maribacter antarcticus]